MGIETDPKKIEAIQEYPIPLNVKEVHTFVGLALYYQRFIPHFAGIAICDVVSAMGIETDPKKIEAIQEYPIPLNVKEVHTFVGLALYYQRFIPHFAGIAICVDP